MIRQDSSSAIITPLQGQVIHSHSRVGGNLYRLFLSFFSILLLFFISPSSAIAFPKTTFLTVSHPIRGTEGWQTPLQNPLELPRFQFDEATRAGTPVTWMLRFDAVNDATISAYFQEVINLRSDHDLGGFLEITPGLAQAANVAYPSGFSIFNANRIFLSGYAQDQRLKLIDSFMAAFKNRFGFYPRAVGAWHLDAFSLSYLRSRYSVLAALICDEQYAQEQYDVVLL